MPKINWFCEEKFLQNYHVLTFLPHLCIIWLPLPQSTRSLRNPDLFHRKKFTSGNFLEQRMEYFQLFCFVCLFRQTFNYLQGLPTHYGLRYRISKRLIFTSFCCHSQNPSSPGLSPIIKVRTLCASGKLPPT